MISLYFLCIYVDGHNDWFSWVNPSNLFLVIIDTRLFNQLIKFSCDFIILVTRLIRFRISMPSEHSKTDICEAHDKLFMLKGIKEGIRNVSSVTYYP